ncbi:MAG TPA: CYTH domain-containing protein [Gemmatimonadaceae bacterium]|jgi:adenylate cyclase class IV
MIEVELKAVIPDLVASRRRVEQGGGRLSFAGRLEDRRYDRRDLSLAQRDHVLRIRVYRDPSGAMSSASVDFKGPSSVAEGYKRRDEISSAIAGSPEDFARILEQLGFIVTMQIDREIWQYDFSGAAIRFERYPRMDDLVEVEGAPAAIEKAIGVLALPRESFTGERLPDFVRRFESRTGRDAALSDAELAGAVRYDVSNA